MKKSLGAVPAVVAALFLFAGRAQSSDVSSSASSSPGVSIGGRGMYFKPNDGDGSWSGGAQVRFHLTPTWALEGSGDFRREHFGNPVFGETRVDTYPLQASLLAYLFPDSPVSPFILGGAGWYFTHTTGPNGYDNTQNRFGPHLGGGLEVFLNRSWSLDGTYRYVWIEDVKSKDASVGDKNYSDKGHMITAALNYHF